MLRENEEQHAISPSSSSDCLHKQAAEAAEATLAHVQVQTDGRPRVRRISGGPSTLTPNQLSGNCPDMIDTKCNVQRPTVISEHLYEVDQGCNDRPPSCIPVGEPARPAAVSASPSSTSALKHVHWSPDIHTQSTSTRPVSRKRSLVAPQPSYGHLPHSSDPASSFQSLSLRRRYKSLERSRVSNAPPLSQRTPMSPPDSTPQAARSPPSPRSRDRTSLPARSPPTPRTRDQTTRPLLIFTPWPPRPASHQTESPLKSAERMARKRRGQSEGGDSESDGEMFVWNDEARILLPKKRRRTRAPTREATVSIEPYSPSESDRVSVMGSPGLVSTLSPSANTPRSRESSWLASANITPPNTPISVTDQTPDRNVLDVRPRRPFPPPTAYRAPRAPGTQYAETYTPSYVPPINEKVLACYDPPTFFARPEHRHELLFKAIPVVTETSKIKAASKLIDPQTAEDIVLRNRLCQDEMYWRTLDHEIRTGCRCLDWKVIYKVMPTAGWPSSIEDFRPKHVVCQCGKWRPRDSMRDWLDTAELTRSFPSRFLLVIEHLERLVSSLMTWSDTQSGHSRDISCQLVTAAVRHLRSSLDPKNLTQQLRNGSLDGGLFDDIAKAIKYHCAPCRDVLVDEFIEAAKSLPIGVALCKLFECMECMKVDNLTYSMTGFIKQNAAKAPEFLRQALRHRLLGSATETPCPYLEQSRTQAWLREASTRVIREAPTDQRNHLLARCVCASSAELVFRSFAAGLVDLAFKMWEAGREGKVLQYPIDTERDSPLLGSVQLPEVLHQDWSRMSEWALSIIATYNLGVIIMHFRIVYLQHHPTTRVEDMRQIIREELGFLEKLEPGNEPMPPMEQWSLLLAARIVEPDLHARMDIAKRVEGSSEIGSRIVEIAGKLEAMRAGPEEQSLLRKRLRAILTTILQDRLLEMRHDAFAWFFPPEGPEGPKCMVPSEQSDTANDSSSDGDSSDSSQATPVRPRIRNVHEPILWTKEQLDAEARRTSKAQLDAIVAMGFRPIAGHIERAAIKVLPLARLNLAAFADFFTAKGMLIGSGRPTELEMIASKLRLDKYDESPPVVLPGV